MTSTDNHPTGYDCAKCGKPTGMMGHWRGWDKPFSCEEKDNDMAPLVQRTDSEKDAYAQGYLAALNMAIEKCKGTSSAGTVEVRLYNIKEGFLAARGGK